MNQHIIDHTQLMKASRTTREAVCQAYGWEPSQHAVESVAVDVLRYQRRGVGYGAVSQTMRTVIKWWRQAQP